MKNAFYCSLLFVALAWAEPLLPTGLAGRGAVVAAADVVGYTLVNADTDLDIEPLTPGLVLDLATLPTRNLNVRADVSGPAGSVVFALSGAQAQAATENAAPYALFSDYLGDYFAWTPPVGSYTLQATAFDGADGTGPAGPPLTLSFSVVNSVGAVSGFTLVNADTDLDIMPITAGMTLDLSTMPTRNLNIRANANPTVGSVVFALSGSRGEAQAATENVAPFALFSDYSGDYFGWTPLAGTYSLTATPYEFSDGVGNAGTPLTVGFVLTGTAPLAVELTAFAAEARGAGAVQLRWSTASEENNREFEVQRSTDGRAFSLLDRVAGHGSTATAHDYRYTDAHLPATAAVLYYRLRQVDANGAATFSPVRAVTPGPPAIAGLQVYSPVVPDGLLHYAYFGPVTGTEQLEIYTLLGQRHGQFPLGAGEAGTVSVAGLPAGGYVLRLAGGAGRCTGRFVLP